MDPLAHYMLPIGGMELGIHEYTFAIDDYFLSHCEGSPYTSAKAEARFIVDRRTNAAVLDVIISGTVVCDCDRCTTTIDLPLQFDHRVYLKAKDEQPSEDDDVVYLEPGQTQFSVASLLYDLFLLAIPIQKLYDCEEDENPPCDMEILDRLQGENEDDESSDGPSIWDDLKNALN